MAFGFFKKAEKADLIFIGGKVYTQTADLPWAEAVACKDGKILDVGDNESIMEMASDETQIIDLEGKTLLPGFIDITGISLNQLFDDFVLNIDHLQFRDECLGAIIDYVDNNDLEAYVVIGAPPAFTEGLERDEVVKSLDEICPEKPIVVFLNNGFGIIPNSAALNTAVENAQNDGMMQLTIPYLMSVLPFFDFDEMQRELLEIIKEKCERGYTTLTGSQLPDYFTTIVQDFLVEFMQNNMLKQRFYNYLFINSVLTGEDLVALLRQRQTHTVDMEGLLAFAGLDMNSQDIPMDALDEMIFAAADAGFDIQVQSHNKETALNILDVFQSTQGKGYRKNLYALAHDLEFDEEERANYSLGELIFETCTSGTDPLDNVNSVEAAIDLLTIDAAILLGEFEKFGSIEKGKVADFVVFDENPLECASVNAFRKLSSSMTVLNGQIVYDVEEDLASEWYDLLLSQQY